jgi:hypothetical protein
MEFAQNIFKILKILKRLLILFIRRRVGGATDF